MAIIDVAPYALVPSDGAPPREGALVRVAWADDVTGYGDVHPWPELGDPPLAECLRSLSAAEPPGALVARTLALARADGEARRDRRSLFAGLVVPKSHFTVVRPDRFDARAIGEIEALGFDTLKLKVTPATLPAVVELAATIPREWRLRLDANGSFDRASVAALLRAVEALGDRLDFVEDPTVDGDEWPRFSVRGGARWASDRVSCPDPDVVVLKANLVEPVTVVSRSELLPERWVVTSALDHPVGQAFAAWEAARTLARYGDWVDTCGLATHLVYQRNVFSDGLTVTEGRLSVGGIFGIGFDELWRDLPWKRLFSS